MKLQIEKLVYGGAGLAHQEGAGKPVSVPFALLGEVVEARLVDEKSGYGDAELVQVIEASRDRVAAGCAHFGECGGCQYQHANYAAQLAMKVGILRETLERAGLADLPEVQVHAGVAWGYRNRIRFRVAKVDGVLRVGYSKRGGDEFLATRECTIAAPVLWRGATALLQLVDTDAAVARWMSSAVEVEFFATANESKLQMTVFVRKEVATGFAEVCEGLRGLVPELVGGGSCGLGAGERAAAGGGEGGCGSEMGDGGVDLCGGGAGGLG